MSEGNNIYKQMETIEQIIRNENDGLLFDKEETELINHSVSDFNSYINNENDNDIKYSAETQRKNILKAIKQFEQALDNDHEVAMSLINFGISTFLLVKKIECCDPSLIYYHGFDKDGNRCMLIQHVSQINFLLKAQKKKDPSKPAHRIGF